MWRSARLRGLFVAMASMTAVALGSDEIPLRDWTAPSVWAPPAPPVRLALSEDRTAFGVQFADPAAATTSVALPSAPLFFVAVSPCRLADTRGNGFSGAFGPPSLATGSPRNFPITGSCGIPSDAAAVSANLTATNTMGLGFLKAYPEGVVAPTVSTLNYGPGQTVANAAVIPLGAGGGVTIAAGVSGTDFVLDVNGYYALSGERNPAPNSPGNSFTIQGGGASVGSTDQPGGDLTLAAGIGTGLGAGGNVRIQTAGANDLSGTTDNLLVDRVIHVARAKQMTLAAPGFTSLMSIHLIGTHTAGGRIYYLIRATDGGSQIATEEGIIQFAATANSITCAVQTADKLHLGTVNSGCTPGFFNPGSQPGISIFDNVSFSSPAPIVVHEVYFTIENESGASIRLEP